MATPNNIPGNDQNQIVPPTSGNNIPPVNKVETQSNQPMLMARQQTPNDAAALTTGPVQQPGPKTVKPQLVGTQKRGSKLSIRGFLIGCFIFLILISGLVGFGLYYILQNPEQIGGNIDIDTIRQGLRIFAALFFAFLFFLGFGFVIVNGYRLSTTKEGSKIGYIFGLIFGIIILIGSVTGGVIVLQNITNLAGTELSTSNILLVKIPTKAGDRYLHNSPGIALIAPTSLSFELNRTIFDRTLLNTIGNNEIRSVGLDCGNGQILIADPTSYQFIGICLYLQKGNYSTQILVRHADRTTNIEQDAVFQAGTLSFNSEIILETASGPYTLNDAKSEINVGKAPAKVIFDASKIFEDYGLATYDINWDIDGDGTFDRQNDVSFSYNYKIPGIQKVFVAIGGLGEYVYELSFRVAQNDVPICEILPELLQSTSYNLTVQCDDLRTPIAEYSFEILEASGKRVLATEKTQRPVLRYTFPNGGNYIVRLTYLTNEGKKGTYETETINVGNVKHTISYSLYYKGVNATRFEKVDNDTNKDIYFENEKLIIKKIPVELQLTIDSVVPFTESTNIKVSQNGRAILSTDDKNFTFTINSIGEQTLDINISEANNLDNTTELTIPIQIAQSEIIGRIIAIPSTVGFDPFEVRLDASTTTLTDPTDEIVFFTWDFGDGEIKKDTSQGSITHVYEYDRDNNNGEFIPKVTIKTRKGTEETIILTEPILVKKRANEARIISDSHLSQIAGAGETVNFTLTTEGDPVKITWNFGNGDTFECTGRSCVEAGVTYTTPGQYSVQAIVEYNDGSLITTNTLKMLVEPN